MIVWKILQSSHRQLYNLVYKRGDEHVPWILESVNMVKWLNYARWVWQLLIGTLVKHNDTRFQSYWFHVGFQHCTHECWLSMGLSENRVPKKPRLIILFIHFSPSSLPWIGSKSNIFRQTQIPIYPTTSPLYSHPQKKSKISHPDFPRATSPDFAGNGANDVAKEASLRFAAASTTRDWLASGNLRVCYWKSPILI